jgi:hypothetical protein
MNAITTLPANQSNGAFADYADADIFFPIDQRPVAALDDGGLPLAGAPAYKAITRPHPQTGDAHTVAIVSASYQPTPMRSLCAALEDALTDRLPGQALAGVQVHDTQARMGAWHAREYVIPAMGADVQQMRARGELAVGTTIAFRAKVTNSYDSFSSARLQFGGLDLVCTNGMVAWNADAVSKRHTSVIDPALFSTALIIGLQKFQEQCQQWQEWAATEVTQAKVQAVIKSLPGMSDRLAQKLITRADEEIQARGANVYSVLSALTYFSSHPEDERFRVRDTGNDNTAETIQRRTDQVTQWLRSQAWQRFANAA